LIEVIPGEQGKRPDTAAIIYEVGEKLRCAVIPTLSLPKGRNLLLSRVAESKTDSSARQRAPRFGM